MNGSNKNVYCEMSDGGWTLLYSFGNSNKSAFIKTNITNSSHINSTDNLYTNAIYISNTYSIPERHNIPQDYLSFFNSSEETGYINIILDSQYKELKIDYGNGYINSSILGLCNLLVNNNLIESLNYFQHKTTIINHLNKNDIITISEPHSICIIRDVYFK